MLILFSLPLNSRITENMFINPLDTGDNTHMYAVFHEPLTKYCKRRGHIYSFLLDIAYESVSIW